MSASRRIYLDNAATSWPKPEAVYQAVDRYLRDCGAPAGRGVYRDANDAERAVAQTRRRVAEWIGAEEPNRIIFTANGTDSLNLALHGLLNPGDHVVTTIVEHNSVLRPLRDLESRRDVRVTRVACGAEGVVDPEAIRRAIEPATRLICLSHASNVTGAIQPAEAVGRIAAEHGLLFLLDAAQSLGHVPVRDTRAHLIAAPGHKGLLGPLGTGVLYIAPGIERQLRPVRQGGTGTKSEDDRQPDSLPDRYEAGNLNVPGIIGLGAGVEFLAASGPDRLREHEVQLTEQLLTGLRSLTGVTVFGPPTASQRVGVVSIQLANFDPQEAAGLLDSAYGIQVRAGLHCAPLMHTALGTLNTGGTLRFSLGPFTTSDDVAAAIQAVAEMTQ